MTRLLGVVIVACACRVESSHGPLAPTSPTDDRLELTRLFVDAGLPSVLGSSRVEQVLRVQSSTETHRCRRIWVRQDGAHRIAIDDDLDIDYGGFWFAQWPATMRVPADSYRFVDIALRQARAGRPSRETVVAERPSELLAEVVTPPRPPTDCPPVLRRSDVVSALAQLSWVRAMGHEALARTMLARWPVDWTEAMVRDELAQALVRVAFDGLAQGIPRSRVRPWLEQAQRLGPGEASDYAAACVAVLGADPSVPYELHDPESMLAWLADDLVFPERQYRPDRTRDRVGWAPEEMPRSPALDLVVLGWSALPALIEGEPAERLMRRSSPRRDGPRRWVPYTSSTVIRDVVWSITLRRFTDDTTMREWWRTAKGRDPSDVLIDHLVHGYAGGSVVS